MLARTPSPEGLKAQLASLRLDLSLVRLALLERKYSADQPRVPAGSPDGGRWTDGEGGSTPSSFDSEPSAEAGGQPQFERVGNPPAPSKVDLREEEGAGHAIKAHVAIPTSELVRRLKSEKIRGVFFDQYWRKEGSFDGIDDANRYVNDVLDSNPEVVASVASGKSPYAYMEKRYDTPTGREAYRATTSANAAILTRTTFSVAVVIVHRRGRRGFYVDTAFPKNKDSEY